MAHLVLTVPIWLIYYCRQDVLLVYENKWLLEFGGQTPEYMTMEWLKILSGQESWGSADSQQHTYHSEDIKLMQDIWFFLLCVIKQLYLEKNHRIIDLAAI